MLKAFKMASKTFKSQRVQVRPCLRVARWFILRPKFQFGYSLEGLGMENVGIIYGHLV
jgi:hypothetical protein